MRGLLLAASLVAVLALPTRLRTRANAAETALADTKVDGDRVLPALQRLDADLEESERRLLRPKTRELERTERFRAGAQKVIDGDCKDVITEGMTRAQAFKACSYTKRLSKNLKKPKQCYFLVKDFSEGTGWRHRCSSNPSKQMRNGWLFWTRDLLLDERRRGLAFLNRRVAQEKAAAEAKAGAAVAMALAGGQKVVALYDYKATEEDELSFKQHEIITVLGKDEDDEGWYIGTSSSGEKGLFPVNYVKVLGVPAKGPT